MARVEIVPFQPRHLDRVVQIEQAAFSDPYPRELFLEYYRATGSRFELAKCSRRIVGYVLTILDRAGSEIISVAVDPAWRHQGIGSALMSQALESLRNAGAFSVRLTVRADNAAAQNLYRRFGFRRIAKLPNYYEDGAEGVRMRKRLL